VAEDLKGRFRELVRGVVARPLEAPHSPRQFMTELLRCPTCGKSRTGSREEAFVSVLNKIFGELEPHAGRCATCGAPEQPKR